jgi:hypothetical protein
MYYFTSSHLFLETNKSKCESFYKQVCIQLFETEMIHTVLYKKVRSGNVIFVSNLSMNYVSRMCSCHVMAQHQEVTTFIISVTIE